jgi:hypothetical protein
MPLCYGENTFASLPACLPRAQRGLALLLYLSPLDSRPKPGLTCTRVVFLLAPSRDRRRILLWLRRETRPTISSDGHGSRRRAIPDAGRCCVPLRRDAISYRGP